MVPSCSLEKQKITLLFSRMANAQHKGFKRIYNAFFYSMSGLAAAWKYEEAFRQEVILAVVLLPTAFWLGENTLQIGLLVFSVFVVLITELLNSCVEAAIDRISDEKHELSKRAKDFGSAAVFISLVALTVVWGLVIYARFF